MSDTPESINGWFKAEMRTALAGTSRVSSETELALSEEYKRRHMVLITERNAVERRQTKQGVDNA